MRLKKILLISLCLAMLMSTVLIGVTVLAAETPWTDVKDTWYTDAVVKANSLGIMKGTSGTTFEPMKPLTRAEYVTILGRLDGGEENLPYSFTDIPEKAWYRTYVGWAEQAGIVNGYNGDPECFSGNTYISRAEMMVMTARYMKYKWISFEDAADIKDFTDKAKVDKIGWAAEGIELTRRAGLIKGDSDGNFNPTNTASRAEIATIVVRFVDKLPEAKDPMFMKFEHLTELVECEGNNPVLTYGKWLPVKHNRPDAIGDQILPQMGLDTEVYELVMADEHYRSFKLSYQDKVYKGEILHGECFKGNMANFGIRNKVTGEETAKRMHLCNVYYDDSPMDPSVYDVDIPEELHRSMLERGVHSTGNVARLASAFDKAEAGEDLNVCYIGGSITAGGGAQANGNWVSGVTDWLQRQFPKSKVSGYNAGIGGTGSQLGILRLDKHVLNFDPDIVFVEFSANDQSGESYRESFEALIRKCLEYDEDTAVVIVLVANGNKDNGLAGPRKNHFEFAEYYELPIVDIHMGVHVGVDAGEFTFEDFTHDGGHPTTWGHMVMSDIVEYFLSVIREEIKNSPDESLKIKSLPEMLCADTFVGYKPIDDSNTENLVSMGDWEMIVDPDQAVLCVYNVWTSGKIGGKPLTFKFTGSELYAMMYNRTCVTVTATDGV
ncbi:MAG: S-layer homology domain-containing protein, partial [Clostridia bacterium]|nr:S-layer homology domain-containing protein [Clostridia bacterium]